MGAYDRVLFEGHKFNRRTVQFLQQVRIIYYLLGGTGKVVIAQGSYSNGPNSAGTHSGGGAVDWDLTIETAENWRILQRANRICGGADWDRPPNGIWGHHNHCIVIGDREMDPSAGRQVQQYYARTDGLAGHGPDDTWRPSVIPVFRYPLGSVNLENIRREAAKTSGWTPLLGVKRYQSALNLKVHPGIPLVVDGIFGPRTKRVNANYEKGIGGDGNGMPGEFGATLLGAARFWVRGTA